LRWWSRCWIAWLSSAVIHGMFTPLTFIFLIGACRSAMSVKHLHQLSTVALISLSSTAADQLLLTSPTKGLRSKC
jgi:hypothetical protein